MEQLIGNSIRSIVGSGGVRPRQRYGLKADGTRGAIGVEIDVAGTPMAQFGGALIGGPTGYAAEATIAAPAPLLADLPPAGTLVELTGNLVLRMVGGDFGSIRLTVLGVTGIRPLGSAVEVLNSVGAQSVSAASVTRDRSAS